MKQLLARNPPLNETDDDGMTPLHIAIDARQVECVDLLVAAGADRRARDRRGRNAFEAANEVADQQDRGAIRRSLFFRQKTFDESTGPAPWTLEYSVMHSQTGVTKMLLSMGVNPNAVGTRGTTPLSDAALTGNLEDVRLLLQAGAKLDPVSPAGTQPIHDAALGDSAGVIQELARQGADINARSREEARTPLHFAAAMGKMNAVQALIALDADLAAKDSKGRTPLDAAKSAGHTEIAALLDAARTAPSHRNEIP